MQSKRLIASSAPDFLGNKVTGVFSLYYLQTLTKTENGIDY